MADQAHSHENAQEVPPENRASPFTSEVGRANALGRLLERNMFSSPQEPSHQATLCSIISAIRSTIGLILSNSLPDLEEIDDTEVAQTQWLYVIGVESPLKNVLHFPHAGNGRTAVILQTTVEQPSDQIDFCFFRNSRIVYVQEQALRPALIHGMLDANKISHVFFEGPESSPVTKALSLYQDGGATAPNIFRILKAMKPNPISVFYLDPPPAEPNQEPCEYIRSASRIPFFLRHFEMREKLQRELGTWAAELYFTHALDHLAVLLDRDEVPPEEAGLLFHEYLVPRLLIANAASRPTPVRGGASISAKVEAILDLITQHSPRPSLQGIILTSCPVVAIYLEKVLNCFLVEAAIFAEAAVKRPDGCAEPLASIDDVLSRYSNRDIQVLISTFECASQFSKQASHLMFFDSAPSALVYLALALSASPTQVAFLQANDKGAETIQSIEDDFKQLLSRVSRCPQKPHSPSFPCMSTSTGARLTYDGASYLIARVCFYQGPKQSALMNVEKKNGLFQAHLSLSSPLSLSVESSNNCSSAKYAMGEANYRMCLRLLKLGLLNENLLPTILSPIPE